MSFTTPWLSSPMPFHNGPMKIFRWLLIVFTAALPILAASCGGSGKPPDSEILEGLGFTAIRDGSGFPDIAFVDPEGGEHSLSDYRGSVILLNFWATWCPPCRAEIPSMSRLYERLEGGDFVLLALNVRESPGLVASFAEEFGMGFPYALDSEGSAAESVGITSIPTSILIDRDGEAVAVVTGALEWDDEEILAMLEEWSGK
jgi:thiol-disulfide isomerase/thioredoxin